MYCVSVRVGGRLLLRQRDEDREHQRKKVYATKYGKSHFGECGSTGGRRHGTACCSRRSGARSTVRPVPDADTTTVYLTGALAFLNLVLTWCTYRMAQAAERQVEAATAQADAARTQVEAAHRPVLVPFQQSGEHVRFRGGEILAGTGPQITENPVSPGLPAYSAAFLPITNVGMGPALNVRGNFLGPNGSGTARFPTEAVGVGDRGVVAFETGDGQSLGYTGNDSEVSAVVEYEDVAGRLYRTYVTFDVGSNAYRSTLEIVTDESVDSAGDGPSSWRGILVWLKHEPLR
jgi:hypothetical protein